MILQPLKIRKDKTHYIVEKEETGEFFEMPEICIEAIKKINNRESLATIEEQLIENYKEEEVDLLDFLQQLIDLGLVKEVDGKEIITYTKDQSTTGFTSISPTFAALLFNRLTIPLFIILIIANFGIFAFYTDLLPTYTDIFIFDSMVFNILTYMMLSLILIILHEFGHILAIRSFDLPANVQIGNRLFLVVAETDLTAAWKLPSKQRNRLFLGGMFIDQLILITVLIVKLSVSIDHFVINGILSLVVLDIFVKTIYQCCFYMKTDLYYLFENITGCYNLMENGKNHLAKWVPFIKVDNTTTIFEEEEKIVKLYGVFSFIGVLLTMCLFIIYFIPQTIYLMVNTLPHLMNPSGNPYFWDALVIVAQFVLIISLLIYSIRKKRKSASA
ncbi:peptidase [Gracilibacillus salitolerans]|uniref:Peptidase n=1 Tax=Gracilibacillus salitolerans TaxID=2663022 RepID=A0A5Q2TN86_9BACI|nr:peptidase [Gracilibacillus salitolerans]